MPDGPDPLGKRALYWMPVAPEADTAAVFDRGAGRTRDPGHVGAGPVRHARPAGKHALFSDAVPAAEPERDRAVVTADDPVPPSGLLSVACSTCGSVTRVGLVEFVLLQLPVGAWLPRRTFDRWMTCPACRRRTWTSVTLAR
jgi:hypothetical protein